MLQKLHAVNRAETVADMDTLIIAAEKPSGNSSITHLAVMHQRIHMSCTHMHSSVIYISSERQTSEIYRSAGLWVHWVCHEEELSDLLIVLTPLRDAKSAFCSFQDFHVAIYLCICCRVMEGRSSARNIHIKHPSETSAQAIVTQRCTGLKILHPCQYQMEAELISVFWAGLVDLSLLLCSVKFNNEGGKQRSLPH